VKKREFPVIGMSTTLNCTANKQRTLILYNREKMNVLFYPYIRTRDEYRILGNFRKKVPQTETTSSFEPDSGTKCGFEN
jgi:hypothetical protein